VQRLAPIKNQGFSCKTYYFKNYIVKKLTSSKEEQQKEFTIALEAYKNNIGAKPILLDIKNSLIIYKFLEGKHKKSLKIKDIKNIAFLLRKLHKIQIFNKVFNKKKDYVLCHQDLNPKNLIFSKNIKLIDWEYADLNDRYFDLVTIIIEFNLAQKNEKIFLNSYFKNSYKINRKKLNYYKKTYISICIQWFSKRNNQKEKINYQKIKSSFIKIPSFFYSSF
jgi:thiamine kinase-like enzyme